MIQQSYLHSVKVHSYIIDFAFRIQNNKSWDSGIPYSIANLLESEDATL